MQAGRKTPRDRRDGDKNRHTGRQRVGETGRKKDTVTYRQTDRQIRHIHRETDRERKRGAETETETETEMKR